jgi:SAM-dependent methyltransferase
MKKAQKFREPEEEKHIFTEGVDYFKTGKVSIWGHGDKDTLDLLNKTGIHGRWLNLAAGDGRYNLDLLKKADFVIASDIDESALRKLWDNTPVIHRTKLDTKVFDINQRFPFEDESFEGAFCASILHYFPKKILQKIISEIDRILKSDGKIIIEFATDIKRVLPDGKLYVRKSEPQYTFEEGKEILSELLNNYRVKIIKSEVPPEEIKTYRFVYSLSCQLVLLIANKK